MADSEDTKHDEVDPALQRIEEDAGQVLDLIKNLPADSRRRTLLLMQPLMSSTLTPEELRATLPPEPLAPPSNGDNAAPIADVVPASTPDTAATSVQQTAATHQATAGDITLNLTGAGATSKLILQTAPAPTYRKLKTFSGITPVPPGQVDFDTWLLAANQLMKDKATSEEEKIQRMQDSLMKPALKQAEEVLSGNSAQAVVNLLEKVYGTVVDPHILQQQFYASQQGDEPASTYLNRLYLQLQDMKKAGAVTSSGLLPLLVRQFVNSSHDELVDSLHLEEDIPPDYGALLHKVRVEEGKRIRRNLAKKKARCHQVEVEQPAPSSTGKQGASSRKTRNLEQEVEQLRREVAMLKQHNTSTWSNPAPAATVQPTATAPPPAHGSASRSNRSRASVIRFCYKCGDLTHLVNRCRNPNNPELLRQRWAEHDRQLRQLQDPSN